MKLKRRKHRVIGNALIWASMMIASALLTGGEGSDTLLMLMIVGWFASNSLIEQGNTGRCDARGVSSPRR